MPTQNVKLTKREEIADRTMAFYFEKPGGFNFKAGHMQDVLKDAGVDQKSIRAEEFAGY